jgi:peptidoglycan/LPS O-acetylase OafA/YrhL
VILSGARVTALTAPIVFAVLVASLSSDTGPVARLFSLRLFQWLGALSYSLYLAHDLFRPYLNIAAASARTVGERALIGIAFLLASFACAYVLHKYIESPWRARFAAWSNGHRGSRAALVPSNSVSPAENG